MSAITLEACITPSRSAVKPLAATKASKAKRQPKGDLDLPDYVAPEPKTNMERREWDRMSSRMEGPSPLLVASLSLSAGPAADLPHALTGFHSYCASSSRPSPSPGSSSSRADPDHARSPPRLQTAVRAERRLVRAARPVGARLHGRRRGLSRAPRLPPRHRGAVRRPSPSRSCSRGPNAPLTLALVYAATFSLCLPSACRSSPSSTRRSTTRSTRVRPLARTSVGPLVASSMLTLASAWVIQAWTSFRYVAAPPALPLPPSCRP